MSFFFFIESSNVTNHSQSARDFLHCLMTKIQFPDSVLRYIANATSRLMRKDSFSSLAFLYVKVGLNNYYLLNKID